MNQAVWMVTFEAVPVVKVGGLAEVPTNLAVELAARGWDAVVIVPAHGELRERSAESVATLNVPGARLEVGKLEWRGVKFFIVSGGALRDAGVYAEEVLEAKVVQFAAAVGELVKNPELLGVREPSVVHFHDWHSVPALLALRRALEGGGEPALFFHIHLLVRRRLNEELLSKAGIPPDWEHEVTWGGSKRRVSVREALQLSGGAAEKLGALEAHRVVTVSHAYLSEELAPFMGGELSGKARVVYNGTSWRYSDLQKEVFEVHGRQLEVFGAAQLPNRMLLRKYFLLHALGSLPEGEPKVPDERTARKLREAAAPPLREDLRTEAFSYDGPLVITTGRVSRQKGFDLLLEAVPHVVQDLGIARFVFFILPVWGSEDLSLQLLDLSREYPDNVRVVFGQAPSVYKLAHLAADVFAAPSRREPFGIMALEAMVSGVPVVASRVGGLAETVLDIREHGYAGTGFLVSPGDPYELAEKIRDLAAFMEASATGRLDMLAGKIEDRKLRELLEEYPDSGEIIRKSCIERVETHFTWQASARMAEAVYFEALRSLGKPLPTLSTSGVLGKKETER
ncbi:MAG: glycogen/starch synthase [Thermofilum sp.]